MNQEKKKVLIVATVSGFLTQFETENVKTLLVMGFEVHYATNFKIPVYAVNDDFLRSNKIIQHQVEFDRSPFSLKNVRAYMQLKKIILNNDFELVHCHTPIGGVLTRLVTKSTKTKNVIYTAHGFHFYKGAPIKNWLLFYPVEKYLSKYSRLIVTITKEDYEAASKFTRGAKVVYINGVGVDNCMIRNTMVRKTLREELEIPEDAIVVVSVGELNKNKNHQVVVQALSKIRDNNIFYIICGDGSEKNNLLRLGKKLKIEDRIKLLGYRTDIIEIMKCSDIYALPSLREGKSVSLMKAMAVGLPVVASNIRGNNELVRPERGGYLVEPEDPKSYVDAFIRFLDSDLRRAYGEFNLKAIEECSIEVIKDNMRLNYIDILNTKE